MATLLDTVTPISQRPLVVRFAGDSGDGIQLAGHEFARSSADAGVDFMTFPDYPAEIRAPAGTTYGVSAFQIQFGPGEVLTPGDDADVLIVFNPAALKTNLQYLRHGGLLIVDETHFDARGLKKAGVEGNPLEDDTLEGYRLFTVAITKRALEALASLHLGRKHASRARNFWALGLVYWLFGRDIALTVKLLESKFAGDEEVLNANLLALKAGHAHGETIEVAAHEDLTAHTAPAMSGKGRIISGTQAMALGIAAIPALSQREIIYCSYPITPASSLLHALARYKNGISTFQAEDEIAAASAAIGASYGGALGMTASSGPGLALKTEAIGLAVMAELPLVVIDVQRAGPSTGMPTKPEQSDLTMAIHGRHGESQVPVFAPATPEDCFWVIIEAARTAIEAMTPVIVLSDAYLANAASDWTPPDVDLIPDITVAPIEASEEFKPYARDETTLARAWVTPGTKGFAHRIGGIEKQAGSGHISYDPDNHAEMVRLRADKIARIAERRPASELDGGAEDADILVIGWGSTYGAIKQAVRELNDEGNRVAHVHVRQLWPLPKGLGELLERFPRLVTAEMNAGQLASILRSEYLKPVGCISQITGQPFRVRDLKSALLARIEV